MLKHGKNIIVVLGNSKQGRGILQTDIKTILNDELYSSYKWFQDTFETPIQRSGDEFFSHAFDFRLLSIGENMNILSQGDSFFVTKIRLDKQYDVFVRIADETVKIILDRILGKSDKTFSLNKITELEAKIITSFNDYIFNNIVDFIAQPTSEKRKNYVLINMTFFVKDLETEEGAKLILTLPKALLTPKRIEAIKEKFFPTSFPTSLVDINIQIGTTKFPVCDLKSLEKEDIVVFEGSILQNMTAIIGDWQKDFRITPNPALIISVNDNNGGQKMDENVSAANLWDNIQVEMGAEFDKVKISLGELKNIEEGLVVDISSVYNNKVSLKVEDKTIARGELVIVNDRYGVRIDEVFADEAPSQAVLREEPEISEVVSQEVQTEAPQAEDGEFDYSDFELDDDDI